MKHSNKGGTSLFVLFTTMVLLIMGLGVSAGALQSYKRSGRDTKSVQVFQAAQAGLEAGVTEEFADLEANRGQLQARTFAIDDFLEGIAPNATGTFTMAPTADPRKGWATCTVTVNGMTKSVRTFVDSRNVGIWNNAIFAGSGAVGQAINGNVDVRGSVHILGEGEPFTDVNGNRRWDAAETFVDRNRNGTWDPGEPFTDANGDNVWNPAEPYNDTNANGFYDPPLTQTDLNSNFSGNAYIGNHYSGMPGDLESMVPAAPRVSGIEQLGAEVRVKHGRIAISGTATIGSLGLIDGGTSKNRVDGSYVSDGYSGNQGASSVFSDNGTTNGYDLGNLGIQFPIISGIGAQTYQTATSGGAWPTQEAFLEARSLNCPVTTIEEDTPAFTYGPDAYGNSITFTPKTALAPATLVVNGVVRFNPNLVLGDSKETICFAGNGTLYARQDIEIHCSFLPLPGLTFPTTARVGFIAKRNMGLATGGGDAQLKLCGAFYAQGRITSRKQNQVAGTFVSNYFDMGTNVPNIYQVPALATNMPPAMPGDKLYFTLKIKSWRER